MEIRMFMISYSKQKAKNIRNLEENLSKEAHRLQKVAEKAWNQKILKKYDNVMTKLDKISFARTCVHECILKPVGMNSENEAQSIFSILRKEIMKTNASPV